MNRKLIVLSLLAFTTVTNAQKRHHLTVEEKELVNFGDETYHKCEVELIKVSQIDERLLIGNQKELTEEVLLTDEMLLRIYKAQWQSYPNRKNARDWTSWILQTDIDIEKIGSMPIGEYIK